MGDVSTGEDGAADGSSVAAPTSQAVRKLEDGVKILSFRGGQEFDELHYVNYYPNGRCEGYEIEIGDGENRISRIKVDAVTGKAKVKRD